jgi:hypothetical protein
MGQRVFSIAGPSGAPRFRAGIHSAEAATAPLEGATADGIVSKIQKGIADRIDKGGRMHKADEHWLQAVIRRHPWVVGIEQPALREVPAWRPQPVAGSPWGRGFIDLFGLDGFGDMRLVETKLAANPDDMLVLQGLDYYVWACAYKKALAERLGASARARVVLHYVIGATPAGVIRVSPHAAAQADALAIPWRVQTVTTWYVGDPLGVEGRVRARLLPPVTGLSAKELAVGG